MPDLFRRGWPQPTSGQLHGISSGYISAAILDAASGSIAVRLAVLLSPLIAAWAAVVEVSVQPTFTCTLSGCTWAVSVQFSWLRGC